MRALEAVAVAVAAVAKLAAVVVAAAVTAVATVAMVAVTAAPAGAANSPAAAGPPPTVYAAASLTDALTAAAAAYARETGRRVRHSFASSAVLARQIDAGAPADVYVSADVAWMDHLAARGRIEPASRRDLLGNRLALVAPADSTLRLELEPGAPLRAALGGRRLAIADPDGVPAGRYARAALHWLGAWDGVADRLVRADDVRAALAFVARGEVPLGIVYATDARAERRVRVVGLFPEAAHPPIVYPVALVRGAAPGAAEYVEWLRGPAARAVFERHGFAAKP